MLRVRPPTTVDKIKWRVAYACVNTLRALFGERRVLRWLLGTDMFLRRLCVEESIRHLGTDSVEDLFSLKSSLVLSNIPSGSQVLDVGCGSGRWIEVLDVREVAITGIDSSQQAIANCRARWPQHRFLTVNVESPLADLLGDKKFDVTILSHVIEHLEAPLDFLTQLSNHTSLIILEVPDFTQDPLNIVRSKLNLPIPSDADHKFEFSHDSILDLVTAAGLKVQEKFRNGGTVSIVARYP